MDQFDRKSQISKWAAILVILLLTVSGLYYFQVFKKTKPQRAPETKAPQITLDPKSLPRIGTLRGTVSSVNKAELKIKIGQSNETFLLPQTLDVRKLISGIIERGDAQTIPAKMTDLKGGQEVLVIVNQTLREAQSIVILK